jgi:adenylyltransferase/sulfurtransferase
MAAGEAVKLLAGFGEQNTGLLNYDLWDQSLDRFEVLRRPDCLTCGEREFEFLNAERGSRGAILCGRNAVQISPGERVQVDLSALAERLRTAGAADLAVNDFLVRAVLDGLELTVFPDARAIVKGTEELSVARGVYARYVGV